MMHDTRIVTVRDGKLTIAKGSRFPREDLRFAERTLRVDISLSIKLSDNADVDRAEIAIDDALERLRALGEVKTKFDVL